MTTCPICGGLAQEVGATMAEYRHDFKGTRYADVKLVSRQFHHSHLDGTKTICEQAANPPILVRMLPTSEATEESLVGALMKGIVN